MAIRGGRPLIIITGVAALLVAITVSAGAVADERLSRCGADLIGNRVSTAFAIDSAADIWNYLPAMGRAPELEEDSNPAFVVIFDGDYRAAWLDRNVLAERTVTGVVCVLTSDGSVNIYYDVSRDGLRLPAP